MVCHDVGVLTDFFVDIWSDVVCPFCYLGFRQFHDALDHFEHADDVVIRHHAFELDPHARLTRGQSLDEMLAEKYSMSLERAAALNQRVQDSARDLGMEWSLATAQPTNTFDAHRVIAHAATHGRQEEMLERLFRAYFSEGLDISDHDTLATLSREVGVLGADEALVSNKFADDVRRDENLAAKIGITGVPALILNGRVHLSGAQGAPAMLQALREAWSLRSDQPA